MGDRANVLVKDRFDQEGAGEGGGGRSMRKRKRNGCKIIYEPRKVYLCDPFCCCDYNPEGPQTWQWCPYCKARKALTVCTSPKAQADAKELPARARKRRQP